MPDRIADHYERNAHAFDLARRRDFVERHWLDRFLLAVPKGGQVLDLGCGGGEPIVRYIVDHGRCVTGVDSSAAMIGLVRTRFARHHWVQGDMRTYSPGHAFHGVLAWDSLFHLRHEDQAMMIEKAARWLEPGGAFLFNTGPSHGEAHGIQFGEGLYHASLHPADYRALFAECGLLEIAFAPEDKATGGRTVWFACKRR
jgi:2-polyprenyl-3-methyl-5-hydroxy-6-metoxy-1,4-benzoquinol methylase